MIFKYFTSIVPILFLNTPRRAARSAVASQAVASRYNPRVSTAGRFPRRAARSRQLLPKPWLSGMILASARQADFLAVPLVPQLLHSLTGSRPMHPSVRRFPHASVQNVLRLSAHGSLLSRTLYHNYLKEDTYGFKMWYTITHKRVQPVNTGYFAEWAGS